MQSAVATCPNGDKIGINLHGDTSHGPVVLIHPATAVRERMYWPFAGFLVERGFRVVTYNYRGVGAQASRPEWRGLTMRDWMTQDVTAVTDWAARHLGDAPMLAVGHSLGGHAVGIGDTHDRLAGAVLIASHAGAVRLVRGTTERLRIRLLTRLIAPVTSRAAGYFPAKMLGVGENLPLSAMREWGRWMMMPRYFFDDPTLGAAQRLARAKLPILSIGFDDDPWATPAAIDLLTDHFTQAMVERRQITPSASSPVGHMGFFRERHRDSLWGDVADWLAARLNQPARFEKTP